MFESEQIFMDGSVSSPAPPTPSAPPFSSSFSFEDGERGVELQLAPTALDRRTELLERQARVKALLAQSSALERQAEALLASRNRKRQARSSDNEESNETRKRCPCTICDKSFCYPSQLREHERVHTGERPFICFICSKTFKRAGNLKKHQAIHSDERPYQCAVCLRRFKDKSNLIQHQKIHTGEKAFLCPECGYSCRTSSKMELHKQTHIKDRARPFSCTLCGHSFTSSRELKRHERAVHSDARLCCPICSKQLSSQSSLTVHLRVHTGEKPFLCVECGHKCSTAGNLKVHIAVHELSRSWKIVCSYAEYATDPTQEGLPCQRRFSRPIALDYHIQASHTVEGLRRRLESENQMARFFESNGICFLRDWENAIMYASCPQLALPGRLSRPDFFLPELSAALKALVIIENDEFAHRSYPSECELSRILKITSAVSAVEGRQASRIIFIRFNPHFYTKNGVQFDPSLETRQKALLQLFADLRSGAVPTQDDGLTLIYLFYDQIEGRLCFFKNSDSQLSTIYEERSIIYV